MTVNWNMEWRITFLMTARETRGLWRPYGLWVSTSLDGGSRVRAKEANPSMIRLAQRSWVADSGLRCKKYKKSGCTVLPYSKKFSQTCWFQNFGIYLPLYAHFFTYMKRACYSTLLTRFAYYFTYNLSYHYFQLKSREWLYFPGPISFLFWRIFWQNEITGRKIDIGPLRTQAFFTPFISKLMSWYNVTQQNFLLLL